MEEKKKQLVEALRHIEKRYGKGVVMRLGERPQAVLPVIRTGSWSLDHAVGIGGLPRGRMTEIYGPPSSGKSTLALHCMAEVQKEGGTALLIDSEHAFDATYAAALGVKVDDLLVCQPDYGEQALDIAEQLIKSNTIDLVVVDSVSALVPEAELKGDMGAQHIGGQARLMSQAMRKLTAITHKTGVACLFINQLRQKIGVMFGSPETTSGGNALKFFASIRLDIRRIAQIKDRDQRPIGHRAKIKVVKNKVAPPFKEVQFDIYYSEGISKTSEIIDLSLSLGLIQQAGAWFSCGEEKIGQGREAIRRKLAEDSAWKASLCEQIEQSIRPNLA